MINYVCYARKKTTIKKSKKGRNYTFADWEEFIFLGEERCIILKDKSIVSMDELQVFEIANMYTFRKLEPNKFIFSFKNNDERRNNQFFQKYARRQYF